MHYQNMELDNMRLLEIIDLRTAADSRGMVEQLLRTLLAPIYDRTVIREIRVYRHLNLETDISIHLRHETDNPGSAGMKQGMRLAAALGEFGLVHHTIWVQTTITKGERNG